MEKSKKTVSVAVKITLTVCLIAFVVKGGSFSEGLLAELALMSAKSYLPVWNFVRLSEQETTIATQVHKAEETTAVQKLTAAVTVKKSINGIDSDIKDIIKMAERQSSDDKKDGEIYEYTFTDDGVTDSFGNVRVKNTNRTQIDISERLSEELALRLEENAPQILIYHTHTTETYQLLDRNFYAEGFLSRSNDENLNMVRVGKAVKQELEAMGYKVIHDTTVYDKKYSGAYERSMEAASACLERYPSIKITLDIHRDAIQNDYGVKTKPTAVIGGKKAAQIMIIAGCQEEGNGITDLPEWEKNLTFALKLQQSMEELFPGLTRPVFFCARSYNMGLTPWSLLVEMGTDANTLDEAVYSGKMLGRALGEMLRREAA